MKREEFVENFTRFSKGEGKNIFYKRMGYRDYDFESELVLNMLTKALDKCYKIYKQGENWHKYALSCMYTFYFEYVNQNIFNQDYMIKDKVRFAEIKNKINKGVKISDADKKWYKKCENNRFDFVQFDSKLSENTDVSEIIGYKDDYNFINIELIKNLTKNLNKDEINLIKMRFYENLTYGQIGNKIGISKQAVKLRMDNLLKKLRVECKKQNITNGLI